MKGNGADEGVCRPREFRPPLTPPKTMAFVRAVREPPLRLVAHHLWWETGLRLLPPQERGKRNLVLDSNVHHPRGGGDPVRGFWTPAFAGEVRRKCRSGSVALKS
ncbi:MAG: hypothetical protein DWP97_04760 [Calditrichaeota bacterium]|nr:MAG: hypothetical protein DWP97_04760 [Calditrichota bacterium]